MHFRPLSKSSFKPLRCRLLSQGGNMRRREFLGVLGSAAAALPLSANAQQASTITRIGFLSPNTIKSSQALANFQTFRAQMHELGLSEGRNFNVDYKDSDDPRGLS